MADIADLRAKVLGADSRNAHFQDAVERVSGKPYNGMMDDPDIPRFGADRTYDDD